MEINFDKWLSDDSQLRKVTHRCDPGLHLCKFWFNQALYCPPRYKLHVALLSRYTTQKDFLELDTFYQETVTSSDSRP